MKYIGNIGSIRTIKGKLNAVKKSETTIKLVKLSEVAFEISSAYFTIEEQIKRDLTN